MSHLARHFGFTAAPLRRDYSLATECFKYSVGDGAEELGIHLA